MENPNRMAGASDNLCKDQSSELDYSKAKPPAQIIQPETSHKESANDYKYEIYRSEKWRVIVCRNGIQWILQRAKMNGPTLAWCGKSYRTTQKALIRCWHEKTRLPIPVEITSLPERITRCD
jgi:hypothetical protein